MRRIVLLSVLALAACGDDTPSDRIEVATLGDSITAGSPAYDPDPEQRAALGFGQNERSQWQYWAAKKNERLGFRNCGIYGQRTDEIAQRLDDCARGADVLIVQGGINDIAQGRDVELAAENLRTMIQRGKELGLRVATVELLPWNNGYPDADPKIKRLNELIHALAAEEGVPVFPFYSTLEDPERPGRMPEALTIDGDHPSIEGYRLLGEGAFSVP